MTASKTKPIKELCEGCEWESKQIHEIMLPKRIKLLMKLDEYEKYWKQKSGTKKHKIIEGLQTRGKFQAW